MQKYHVYSHELMMFDPAAKATSLRVVVLYSDARAIEEERKQEYQSLLEHHEAQMMDWQEERDALKAELDRKTALYEKVADDFAGECLGLSADLIAAKEQITHLLEDSDGLAKLYAKADGKLAKAREALGETSGSKMITEERKRQIETEGWTPGHDDLHSPGTLAAAGASYAAFAASKLSSLEAWTEAYRRIGQQLWPFDGEWLKPGSALRDLIKAGALIAAEIDRMNRIAQAALKEGK